MTESKVASQTPPQKRKRGRPKTKKTRREYLIEHILYDYNKFLPIYLEEQYGLLLGNDHKHLSVIAQELIENLIPESISKHFKQIKKLSLSVQRKSSINKWYYIAGMQFALKNTAKQVIKLILEHGYYDPFVAASVLSSDEEDGYHPVPTPNDSLRQIRKSPSISRKRINKFILQIKEGILSPYFDDIVKKRRISSEKLNCFIKEANRQKRHINVVDEKGRKKLVPR